MGYSIKITPGAYILLAVLILTLPMPWIAAAIFAGVFHEICHIIVIILLRGQVYGLQIGAGGAKIMTSPLSDVAEFFCALAGPLGSLMLTAAASLLPRVALCGLIQGLFNLLPLYPMDGGRIFWCIVGWIRTAIGKIPCKDGQHRVQ